MVGSSWLKGAETLSPHRAALNRCASAVRLLGEQHPAPFPRSGSVQPPDSAYSGGTTCGSSGTRISHFSLGRCGSCQRADEQLHSRTRLISSRREELDARGASAISACPLVRSKRVAVQLSQIAWLFVAISASRVLIVPGAIHHPGLSIDTVGVRSSGMRIKPRQLQNALRCD